MILNKILDVVGLSRFWQKPPQQSNHSTLRLHWLYWSDVVFSRPKTEARRKKRIAQYLARWLGWAGILTTAPALAGTCSTVSAGFDGSFDYCECGDASGSISNMYRSGDGTVKFAFQISPTEDNNDGGYHIYTNEADTNSPKQQFKCEWTPGVGYSNGKLIVPNVAPTTGTVTANDVTQTNAGEGSYTFTVEYTDSDDGIDVSTIGTSDVTVMRGATIATVSGAGVNVGSNGSPRIATYTVTPPGNAWDDGFNGTYTIALVGGEVCDTNAACVAANTSLATFTVNMDTTAPAAPSTPDMTAASDTGSSNTDNKTNDATPTFTGTAEANSTVQLISNVDGNIGSATATGGNWTITASTLNEGAHNITATATDAASNTSAASSALSIDIDTTAPTVTINKGSSQADPTDASPIVFDVVFNETVTDFSTGDVSLSGTAGATTGTVTGSGTNYTVSVTGMSSSGTVIASLAAGVASDVAGNTSAASTSTDNEVTYYIPGFTVTETSGTTSVNESGSTDTFTVVLDSPPTSNVQFSLTSGNTGEVTVSPSPLTFTSSNWNSPQTVTVTGVDDGATSDGDQTTNITVSVVDANSDDQFDSLADKTVSVTTVDNDSPGITVNPTNLTFTESSGNADFTITLNTQPTGGNDVTIPITTSSPCTVSTNSAIVTNADWNTGTNVTVTATNDNIINTSNRTCTVTTGDPTSSDTGYENLNASDVADISVTITDDDSAGINLNSSSINVTEGATATYQITLKSQPTGDVNITVTADAQTQVSLDGSTFSNSVNLTFTNTDWDTAQTITVQAVDNSINDGNRTATITHAVIDPVVDTNYPTTLSLGNVSVNITDDEAPDTSNNTTTGSSVHIHQDRYQLGVAGHLAHIKSSPSGIDCEYGEGTCSALFDRGTTVQLELVKIKTKEGFSQDDYDITWEGTDSGCAKQVVTLNNGVRCLVKVYGKQGMDYSSGSEATGSNNTGNTDSSNTAVTNQLQFLNFSGHSTLRGEAEDVFLGFILEGEEGTADVILHADILEEGVLPQLDFNEVIIDEQGIRGSLLKRHQHSDNFILEHNVGAGIYTIQMSSVGAKGRGMAGITLKNNQLDLTNLSVRGHLKDFLVLNFIVGGEGKQKIQVNTRILSGNVVTELHLLDLLSQQDVANEALTEGAIIEVGAGAYAILLKVVSGQGIGMIGVDLLQ